MKGRTLAVFGVIAVLALTFGLGGCSSIQKDWGWGGSLETEVAAEAKLIGVKKYVKPYKGAPALWYEVTLENVSQADQRFRVNIFLDNGKAVGGLVPRKVKKGLIKPGKTVTVKYPFKGFTDESVCGTLMIKTMSK